MSADSAHLPVTCWPDSKRRCVARGWAARLGGDVAAVDGKALRRSFEDAASRSPLHLVQAFSTQAKLVLGQVEADGRSNGIPALPRLLELLDVEGRLVSGTPATTPATTGKRRRLWMGGMCRTWDDGIRQARNSRP